jgi:predicted secreted protein
LQIVQIAQRLAIASEIFPSLPIVISVHSSLPIESKQLLITDHQFPTKTKLYVVPESTPVHSLTRVKCHGCMSQSVNMRSMRRKLEMIRDQPLSL